MALPTRLKSARMTDATAASTIDNNVGALEQALCDLLGITIDTDYASVIIPAGSGSCNFSLITAQPDKNNTNVETVLYARHLTAGDLNKLGALLRVKAAGFAHNSTGSTQSACYIEIALSSDGTVGGLIYRLLGGPQFNLLSGGGSYVWNAEANATVIVTGASGKLRAGDGHFGLFSGATPNIYESASFGVGSGDSAATDLTAAPWIIATVKFPTSSVNLGALINTMTIEILPALATV